MCDLYQIFVHVGYGRGSVLIRWCCDTSCTSGFVIDVIFSHYRPESSMTLLCLKEVSQTASSTSCYCCHLQFARLVPCKCTAWAKFAINDCLIRYCITFFDFQHTQYRQKILTNQSISCLCR